ncbi:nicotinamide-nucleotide amidase [Alteromonadaceae bacterium M269]|nr:nicotinamide-nucleotide amidase [Alteromonadaceae bacterium M269]
MSLSAKTVNLAVQLGTELRRKNWHITCAESCTGGGLGYAITSVAGSSAWFERGFITYSNGAKSELIGVEEETLQQFGAVSQQVVEQMAQGALKAAGANVAVSISGVAGPDGGSKEKPVGTVWFGFALEDKVYARLQQFDGDRQSVREQAMNYALSTVNSLISTSTLSND